MTTSVSKRCRHCGSPYVYHPSFYGGDETKIRYNNPEHCPDCFKVASEALSKILRKYEKRFIPSTNYTREEIVSHQEKRCSTGIPFRRISPGLYDMKNPSRKYMQVMELMPDGFWYMAEWWSDKQDEVTVRREDWVKIGDDHTASA